MLYPDMMLGGLVVVLVWEHLGVSASIAYMICISQLSDWSDWTLATAILLVFSLYREVLKRVRS